MAYKLGSLFDGSGGFPLAASLCGIEPRWAAEVEPYPIAVTSSRFPNMVHLGDISKVNGGDIEPVDVISFGSPCQDLSVAGKRAGMKHADHGDDETTRSGLFYEAVRIFKEMREKTNGEYPKWLLWENVFGAFSSNNGEDFRCVLQELIQIVEPTAVMPEVPKNGWPYSDCYIGDGWSLAYRLFDAQYWGVPQRRRRIHLILSLTDERAEEVLFEREGLRGYFAQSGEAWQEAPGDASDGSGAADPAGAGDGGTSGRLDGLVPYTVKIRGGVEVDSNGRTAGKGALIQEDLSATPGCANDQTLFQPVLASGKNTTGCLMASGYENQGGIAVVEPIGLIDNIGEQSEYGIEADVSSTLRAGGIDAFVYGTVPQVYDARGNGDGGTVSTLTGDHENRVTDYTAICCEPTYSLQGGGETSQNSQGSGVKEDISFTLNTTDRHGVAYCMDVGFFNAPEEGTAPTLLARQWKDPHLVTYAGPVYYIVRRLTPIECARLQGFADWWGIVPQKDALTPEEFRFWHEVRNTHARINGKAEREYTEEQILKWYNSLHTDAAEYKMWGNGIALPPALYCMQGIREALDAAEEDAWMM